ncbi:MAG: hypothetical protein JWQ40_3233 [Segetibacter sp.]|jgi:CheY-like chemotaxis protein|nr:hypothetical protein [Segetibacter sp.]
MNSTVKILIVDDDPDDSEFLSEGISKTLASSYSLHTVTSGVECLSFLKTNDPPEFIFLDLNMPRKNGIECLKCIKENNLLKNTHVIICSTSSSPKDIDASYHLGATFYLVKPVSFATMVNHLARVFKELANVERGIVDAASFVVGDRQKVSV